MPEETTTTAPAEEHGERFRRPVAAVLNTRGQMLVVCSDGSTWANAGEDAAWIEAPPIPGSWRAKRWGTE